MHGTISNAVRASKCQAITVFAIVGFMLIYSIVADEFVVLFVSGYIFEDVEFVAKHLPIIDFIMTALNEQVNPMNAIFVTFVINYFAQEDKAAKHEAEKQ